MERRIDLLTRRCYTDLTSKISDGLFLIPCCFYFGFLLDIRLEYSERKINSCSLLKGKGVCFREKIDLSNSCIYGCQNKDFLSL